MRRGQPSTLLWIRPEIDFSFTVDETGQHYPATVLRIGAEVDAISKTVPIIAAITDTTHPALLPGMSGTAHYQQPLN